MNGKEIMEKKHLLLTIEYDGTCFSGWQRQPGRRTVQGELERVLSVLCGNAISIDGTGRTEHAQACMRWDSVQLFLRSSVSRWTGLCALPTICWQKAG